MVKFIILLALFLLIATRPMQRITDYSEYLKAWKSAVPEQYIHDVSHYALPQEDCFGKCQFFYYEHHDSTVTDPCSKGPFYLSQECMAINSLDRTRSFTDTLTSRLTGSFISQSPTLLGLSVTND